MDHMRRGSLKLDGLRGLVLDEADEMLRMGFAEDVDWILTQALPSGRSRFFRPPCPIRFVESLSGICATPPRSRSSRRPPRPIRFTSDSSLSVHIRKKRHSPESWKPNRSKLCSFSSIRRTQPSRWPNTFPAGPPYGRPLSDVSQSQRERIVERLRAARST